VLNQIRVLTSLQEIDLQIFSLDRERGRATARRDTLVASKEELAARLEKDQTVLSEREKHLKKDEGEIATEKTNLKKWKARLNDSKNSRESLALVREIDLHEKQIKDMEETALNLMEEIEGLTKSIATMQSSLDEMTSELLSETSKAAVIIEEIDTKVTDLKSQRAQYTERIDGVYLGQYNFIKAKRNGFAVCSVKDGICTGCNMFISPHLYTQLVQSDQMITCPSCQRIIYAQELFEEDNKTE